VQSTRLRVLPVLRAVTHFNVGANYRKGTHWMSSAKTRRSCFSVKHKAYEANGALQFLPKEFVVSADIYFVEQSGLKPTQLKRHTQ
jgi:hypothetical protein